MLQSPPERASPCDGAVTKTADGLRVRLHVTPRAAADRIGAVSIGADGGRRLKVGVTAPPHDGEANTAIVKLLAREWRIPKTALSLVAGGGGRDKVVAIRGDANVLAAKLDAWSAGRRMAGEDRP